MNKKIILWGIILITCTLFSEAAGKQKLTVDDMFAFKEVDRPVVSPDGKLIAFTIEYYCPHEKKRFGDIYLIDMDGRNRRRLTAHPAVESGMAWSPDSRRIAFSAQRECKKSQVYIIGIDGGEAVRLTDMESGARSPRWSPDGRWIAFYSSQGEKYSKELKEELGDVRYLTHLRYYHYRSWDDGKRQRIFIVPADGSKEPIQMTDGDCSDEGDFAMAWSPDSREIAFVSNRDKEWWNSIDTNIYSVSVPDRKIKQLTLNRGPDHSPAYSPDGRYIAYRSIFTYNYESENYKVVVTERDGSRAKVLTEKLDRSVRSFRFDPGGRSIYFLFGSEGVYHIKKVPLSGGSFKDVVTGRHVIRGWDMTPDGRTLVLLRGDDIRQPELYTFRNNLRKITSVNDAVMARFYTQPVEEIRVTSTDNTPVQGWLIKPVDFNPGQKYPLILSIHGGPHGMSTIGYRFYFQLLAANGYVVLYTNPRASLGYGEKFSRQIWEDWGGQCYRDVMAAVDSVLQKGYIDEKKMGVTGGSFGGYMTNWIVGQTDRFAAAVTVAGLSNLTSFYGTTDEQFFPEAEFKGKPWENREVYLKHSPIWYAGRFKTPTMLIHGQFDFRVRTEQAEQMFTALQKQGVPSVYVWFPDEGHGVRKPVHRKLYYKLILDWFGHYLQGKPAKYPDMVAGGENRGSQAGK